MPHVVVKLWPGRSEELKSKLTDGIVKEVTTVFDCGAEYVSVAFEEIDSNEWAEAVYKPEIEGNWDKLYKKPGYKM